MSADTPTSLPSVVDEIKWMIEALTSGFEPGEPVDGELLDRLVDHLGNVKRLAALVEEELAASRALLSEMKEGRRVSAACVHPNPEKMQ